MTQRGGETISVISLGAGVQSTTLLLMACGGLIEPRPVEAIFADTQSEPAEVYRHLEWLESVSTIPIRRVTNGSLRDKALERSMIPAFVRVNGDGGPLNRSCTRDYKIRPLRRRQKQLMREHGADHVNVLMGISLDEATRMTTSRDAWQTNAYPLVDHRMTRHDCLLWLERRGYPRPPKSACTFCPYHDNRYWRDMRDHHPDDWADAVAFDEAIRQGLPRVRGDVFLHRSMVPLRLVDLSTPQDRGQLAFDLECEGYCGV
jgi:hypothetical protein